MVEVGSHLPTPSMLRLLYNFCFVNFSSRCIPMAPEALWALFLGAGDQPGVEVGSDIAYSAARLVRRHHAKFQLNR